MPNESFRGQRVDENGQPRSFFRTSTGHWKSFQPLAPRFSGRPFLLVAHAGRPSCAHPRRFVARRRLFHSLPHRHARWYRHLWFSQLALPSALARRYVESAGPSSPHSLFVGPARSHYMYFNPSCLTHILFLAVALFLWVLAGNGFSRSPRAHG